MNRATVTGCLLADPMRSTPKAGRTYGVAKFYALMGCGASILCHVIAAQYATGDLLSFQEGDRITASGIFALAHFDDWRGEPQPMIEVLADEIAACPEVGD